VINSREIPVIAGSLIDTELHDGADPVGVIDEWGAVLDHRVHDRPPTHPELVTTLG
jgi:hypothetical protein